MHALAKGNITEWVHNCCRDADVSTGMSSVDI